MIRRNPFVNQVLSNWRKGATTRPTLRRNPFVNQVLSNWLSCFTQATAYLRRNPFVNQVLSNGHRRI